MPTIIRRSFPSVVEPRREVFVTTTWHVHSNVWIPPTDVYETEDHLIAKVEIAGMREEDFEVSVEDQILMIRGFRPDVNERRAYHQMEIRFVKLEIKIGLPVSVDLDQATAEYKDGFLTVTFPKKRATQIEMD
ncbi:MAG TPA: Hsp20/alpha crystallin family protein [Anaerolineales bacterium]|nr:Hsp20/alpha crystallin family protein [Anaerolineales bacterium]